MSAEELKKVEDIVNAEIAAALPVQTDVMSIEDAKKTGAMALFGEKYGENVRVVSMGDFSKELCGGTHVANTANIALFKIVSEAGVAAGVRRIEALTGHGSHHRFHIDNDLYLGADHIYRRYYKTTLCGSGSDNRLFASGQSCRGGDCCSDVLFKNDEEQHREADTIFKPDTGSV